MITILGVILLFFVIFSFCKRKQEWLLFGAIFFSGFSGSSVLNVLGTSIQPSAFLFGIYFIYTLFRKRIRNHCPRLLIAFFVYCLLSLIFPLLFKNQQIIVMNQSGIYEKLSFSISNIVHILYLLFCILFLNTLIDQIGTKKLYTSCYNSYKYGFYVVCLICIYQIIALQFNLPFDVLFRQNVHGNIQGARLYGPCIEASMLCYYLIPSILLVLFLKHKSFLDGLFVIIACGIGIYTMSSTFLIGLLLIVLSYFVHLVLNNKMEVCIVFATFILLLCFMTFIVKIPFLYNNIVSLNDKLNKNNFSGIERFDAFEHMIKIGAAHPFGVGFGSCRSKDLFSTWVGNIGFIGVLIYLLFLLSLIVNSKKSYSKCMPFIVVNILMFVSVPEPYNFFIWYLLFVALFQAKGKKVKRSFNRKYHIQALQQRKLRLN